MRFRAALFPVVLTSLALLTLVAPAWDDVQPGEPAGESAPSPLETSSEAAAAEPRQPLPDAAVNVATFPGPGLVAVVVLLLVSFLSAIRWVTG